MPKNENPKSSSNTEMSYSHQVYWYVVVVSGVTAIFSLIPPDIGTVIRVDLGYGYLLAMAVLGLFVFRDSKKVRFIFMIFNQLLILIGAVYLVSYNNSFLIPVSKVEKSDTPKAQMEILLQIGTRYSKQFNSVLQEGNLLKQPEVRDGGNHLNIDLYPKLKIWRTTVADKVPAVYSAYFKTDEVTKKFYKIYVRKKDYDPVAKEDLTGNLFNATFETLKFLRDNPNFYLRIKRVHR
jgi:hypothetical protein